MKAAIILLALLAVLGYSVDESFAQVSENRAFLLEGSGFAVTKENIRVSEIDLGLSSQTQSGSSIDFLTEDGFITLDDDEFIISDLEGKFLREGRYIRINGQVEGTDGSDTTISFFGRLVEESKDASVYSFTGRITTPEDTYKIIYTTKLSTLLKVAVQTDSATTDADAIHIIKHSSTQGIRENISPGQQSANSLALRFFSQDRISIEPGSTITIVNDDLVSHSLLSGKENSGDRYNPFTPDQRISTGTIKPGGSTTITFDEAGFYRLYDPDYTWMKIVAYVFPNPDNLILGQGQNSGN